MNILLVEDDLSLSNDLKRQLQREKFEVDAVYDGLLAERSISRREYDCILLDVNIPGKNGFELIKEIRRLQIKTPVILLTAYGELEDKLYGFQNGADDYITKPFYFQELLARIKVFLKRADHFTTEHTTIADLVIDHKKRLVTRSGITIGLTLREYEIISLLASADGNPVSKKELLRHVWGTNFDANSNTIEVFINVLRNKIDKSFELKLIKTKVGYGYYLGVD